jgi:hypothetical protein
LTSDNDDEKKPIDLQQFKRRRIMAAHNEAYDKLRETMWQELVALWAKYAEELAKVPPSAGGLQESAEPNAIFSRVLSDLVSLAQAHGVDNEHILLDMLCLSLLECKPKGRRLEELLQRAYDLLMYNDEESSSKINAVDEMMKNEPGLSAKEAFARLEARDK